MMKHVGPAQALAQTLYIHHLGQLHNAAIHQPRRESTPLVSDIALERDSRVRSIIWAWGKGIKAQFVQSSIL
jgi:hypothetical protein